MRDAAVTGMTPREQELAAAELEAELAMQALSHGELALAATLMGRSLAADPRSKEKRALLDAVLSTQKDPRALAPLDGDVPYTTAAVHAAACARIGDIAGATALLLEIAATCPDVPYLAWAAEWTSAPDKLDDLVAGLARERIVPRASAAVKNLGGAIGAHDPRRGNATELTGLLARLYERLPEHLDVAALLVAMLRRLGRLDEALLVARRVDALAPSWLSAAELASIYRAQGDVDAAVVAYTHAIAADAGAVAPRLDLADTLLDAGREAAAREAYADVVLLDADNAWARASIAYLDAKGGDAAARARLVALADEGDEGCRAAALLAGLVPPEPFVTFFPSPRESSAVAAREALVRLASWAAEDDGAGGGEPTVVEVELDRAEAPSVAAAFALGMRRIGQRGALRLRAPGDPRAHLGELLWQDRDDGPAPRVDPPDAEIAASLAALAARPFRIDAWREEAKRIGRRLGPTALAGCLGAMAHPPDPPAGEARPDEMAWVARVQLAAALVVAALDAGWEGSLRRSALLALLHARADWSVGAAALALAGIAQEEPSASAAIGAALAEVEDTAPPSADLHRLALVCARLSLPDVRGDARAALLARRDALLAAAYA